jgi:hypothetical protein
MSEEVKPKTAVDLPAEFDSPTFIGASAANSIAVSRFEEAYRSRPPWDIDGPQPQFARLLGAGLIQGRVLDVGCGTGENALFFASQGLVATTAGSRVCRSAVSSNTIGQEAKVTTSVVSFVEVSSAT